MQKIKFFPSPISLFIMIINNIMIKRFTIYGERCSGTNYLENIIKKNFDVEVTWDYGWKHFFGHSDLSNSDDVLFICIVRNPFDWINSFYKIPSHLPMKMRQNIVTFLNGEVISMSYDKPGSEIMEDRNIYTKRRYKNIFELRHTKLKYLIEDLPTKVKNYIFIRYEDLQNDFSATMQKIKNAGLIVKNDIDFPLNDTKDFKHGGVYNPKKVILIPNYRIINHPSFNKHYENLLGYM